MGMNDLIRRQDAIRAIMGDGLPELHYASWFADIIKEIPAAQTEGFWIGGLGCDGYECSNCGVIQEEATAYCPDCGSYNEKGDSK